jgi:hypothetical protein
VQAHFAAMLAVTGCSGTLNAGALRDGAPHCVAPERKALEVGPVRAHADTRSQRTWNTLRAHTKPRPPRDIRPHLLDVGADDRNLRHDPQRIAGHGRVLPPAPAPTRGAVSPATREGRRHGRPPAALRRAGTANASKRAAGAQAADTARPSVASRGQLRELHAVQAVLALALLSLCSFWAGAALHPPQASTTSRLCAVQRNMQDALICTLSRALLFCRPL